MSSSNQKITPAGEFRQLVTLEKPVGTADATTGEPDVGYTPYCECWASLAPLTSRELVRTKAVADDTTHRITIRFRTDIEPTWRVSWDDPRGHHVANITGIIETAWRRELEIQATETV